MHTLGAPVAAFLAELCDLDPNAVTSKDDLFAAWQPWCDKHGLKRMDARLFGRRLIAAGNGKIIHTKPGSGKNRVPSYAGLRLLNEIPF